MGLKVKGIAVSASVVLEPLRTDRVSLSVVAQGIGGYAGRSYVMF